MHQSARVRPLGGLHLHRLRTLREANDNDVRERHLKLSGGVSSSVHDAKRPVDPLAAHTVDAIVQERLQNKENVSTAARLRCKVTAARHGVQTERSERPGDNGKTKTRRKIAAVRRRGEATFNNEEKNDGRRRVGKDEAEWIEKQRQYTTRVATIEKECNNAWQSFFAGAGASGSSSGFVTTMEVNKLIEEMETLRGNDVNKMKRELQKLRIKADDVQMKVEEIENGDEFLSELQERIDAMEAALAKFRLLQRQQFEEYVLEEKVLEKELAMFMEKMEGWENEATPGLNRGGASSASLGPSMMHVSSKSRLISQHSRGQLKSADGEESGGCNGDNQEEDRMARTGAPDELGMVDRVRQLNDAILRSGGLKGGWDYREHSAFTTLLIKCGLTGDVLLHHLLPEDSETHLLQRTGSNHRSNQEEQLHSDNRSDYETRVARFLRKCMRKIVTQTENSVRSHFDWYLRHLQLVEEKKHAIHEWKTRKEEERQQIIQCGFDANEEKLESLDRRDAPHASSDISSRKQTNRTELKSREKTERLLKQWKRDKKLKEEEKEQRRRELQKKRDAVEAKRKQEQLDAKQKVLLYKLQKEQEAAMLDWASTHRHSGVDDGLLTVSAPLSSPTLKEDLVERSRVAIEYAKAKRLRLQQIAERKQKRQQLPPRPESKVGDESTTTSPKPVLVFNATEASKARDLSKEELRKQARRRERQSAHDAYIPGEKAIRDVKFKSFGHIPIQPRAIPGWRKNI